MLIVIIVLRQVLQFFVLQGLSGVEIIHPGISVVGILIKTGLRVGMQWYNIRKGLREVDVNSPSSRLVGCNIIIYPILRFLWLKVLSSIGWTSI